MKYVTILISLVVIFSFLALSQETTTEGTSMGIGKKDIPEKTVASPNASVPNKISYQGILTNSSGAPVADGSYDIKFELFNALSGGTALWSETQTAVTVSNGTFSVLLGSVTPLIGIFYQPLWVEITVVSGPGIGSPVVFSPRTELASAAYALGPWYSNASNIYVTDQKKVGINTTDPLYSLDVSPFSSPTVARFGDFDPIYLIRNNPIVGFNIYYSNGFRYGTSNNGGATIAYDQSINNGLTFNTAPDGDEGTLATLTTRMAITENGNVGIGTTAPDKLLDVAGSSQIKDTLFIGTTASSGHLNLYRSGVSQPVVSANSSTMGGQLKLFDEQGNMVVDMRPNGWGEGGGVEFYSSPSQKGVEIWGNAWGQGQGYISIHGDNRSMLFDPRLAGNSSVQLPDSSISAAEMFNEPGVSNSERAGVFIIISTVGTTVLADSVDITVPASGYIEVTAGAWLNINHTTGTNSEVWYGISETRASQGVYPGCAVVRIPNEVSTSGSWGYPCMTSRFYSVTAGTHRYYVNFYWATGGSGSSVSAGYPYIRAKYYPTLYGTSTMMDPNVITSINSKTDGSESIYIPQITITPEEHLNQLKIEAEKLKREIEETMKKIDRNDDVSQNGGK